MSIETNQLSRTPTPFIVVNEVTEAGCVDYSQMKPNSVLLNIYYEYEFMLRVDSHVFTCRNAFNGDSFWAFS